MAKNYCQFKLDTKLNREEMTEWSIQDENIHVTTNTQPQQACHK